MGSGRFFCGAELELAPASEFIREYPRRAFLDDGSAPAGINRRLSGSGAVIFFLKINYSHKRISAPSPTKWERDGVRVYAKAPSPLPSPPRRRGGEGII